MDSEQCETEQSGHQSAQSKKYSLKTKDTVNPQIKTKPSYYLLKRLVTLKLLSLHHLQGMLEKPKLIKKGKASLDPGSACSALQWKHGATTSCTSLRTNLLNKMYKTTFF